LVVNGIFGLIRFDGQPIDPARLEAMRAAVAPWGRDGTTAHHAGSAGMGCILIHSTPEAVHERLPFFDDDSGIAFCGAGRLDNRNELCDNLGIAPSDHATTPDSRLLFLAYRQWGRDGLNRLYGDWSFAIWDARDRRLSIVRDQHGETAMYYRHGPAYLAFASTQKALLALPDLPHEPDLVRLSQVLTSWPGDGIQTGYSAIRRLPPSHMLEADEQGLRTQRYWYMNRITPLQLESDAAYAERFLELYRTAVTVRLRRCGPVGATLSGGLDSGSVCTLAAEQLAREGQHLRAYTSVPLYAPGDLGRIKRFGDETPFALATAEHAGSIDLDWIRADDVSPLAGAEAILDIHDEPGHATGNAYWIHALTSRARADGMDVLLTGQGGNAGVSWIGGNAWLLPKLVLGQWRELGYGLQTAAHNDGISLLRAVRRYLIRPLIPPALRSHRHRSTSDRPAWMNYSAINPAFARSIELSRLMREAGHDPEFRRTRDPLEQRLKILKPGESIGGALWHQNGMGHGLNVRDPTLDRRLLEFCLAVPDEQYRRDGYDRALIRHAMTGLMADKVRLNRRRGLQAADLSRRVAATAGEIHAVLDRFEGNQLASDILDLPRMRASPAGCRAANPTHAQTEMLVPILLRGIGVGLFALRF
jgi:asparagine synthase (glutamine-hydrolysing)